MKKQYEEPKIVEGKMLFDDICVVSLTTEDDALGFDDWDDIF